jgi:hypothetical protein
VLSTKALSISFSALPAWNVLLGKTPHAWCTGVPKFLMASYVVLSMVLGWSLLAFDWPSIAAEWTLSGPGWSKTSALNLGRGVSFWQAVTAQRPISRIFVKLARFT